MFEDKSRTEIADLGEFGLIDTIKKSVKLNNPSTIKGIGDDAAVLQMEGRQVVTTDMLLEGVHFNLMYAPLKHLGYKAVTVNLSDVYAMNAVPHSITVSIGISNRFSLEAVDALYEGILLACERYKVDLVGGDTTSSVTGLAISVTAIGSSRKETVYRNGAKENDIIMVSGDLGGAYMGLQLLEREKEVYKENPGIQPDLEGNDYILERQLKPEARADVGILLDDLGVVPTSMIDISDGLASELFHICSQSSVGCVIHEDKVPIDPTTYNAARSFELDPSMCALNGGEDYELLFTVKQADYDKLKNLAEVTAIGYITDAKSGYTLVAKDGTTHPIKAQGWQHFDKDQTS